MGKLGEQNMEPVRILVAGAGFMGRTHVEGAKRFKSVRYAGVADSDLARARALAAEARAPAFASVEEALERVRPEAVDICLPTRLHLETIRLCAERGVDVLCEKPLVRHGAEADKVLALVRRHGIRLMVAQVLRFWPEYCHAIESGRSGRYGAVLAAHCRRLSAPPAWNKWMKKPESGGTAIDLQIHDMDFLLQLLGRPRAISAAGRVVGGSVNYVYNRLLYPSSGVPATVESSSLMPESYPFRMFFSIEFERAIMEMDFWRPKGRRLRVFPRKGPAFCPKLPKLDPYGAEVDYFARCLRSGRPFERCPLEESVAALRMCLASEKSCLTGRPASLSG